MWRQFLSALGDADAADPGARDAIISGAQATFALFENALSFEHAACFVGQPTLTELT